MVKKFLSYDISIIPRKVLCTNLIHFLDLLNYFSNFTSLSKKLRIINSTSKNYKELVETIISENRKIN